MEEGDKDKEEKVYTCSMHSFILIFASLMFFHLSQSTGVLCI